jgi:Spy/CpxP family protein refolding chaperone
VRKGISYEGEIEMKRTLFVLFVGVFVMACAAAQMSQSGYVGEEKREIKALSVADVEGYLKGEGMGLAKAAELNGYPGPKHVLEMGDHLKLTAEQKLSIEKIRSEMSADAIRLGAAIVERERELDSLFAKGEITSEKLQSLVTAIARLQGELRTAHLRAHLALKPVLSADQTKMYNQMRGYGADHKTMKH